MAEEGEIYSLMPNFLNSFLRIFVISLNAMVPITLAATGEIIGEKSGVINIGLEGIQLTSAFTSALGAELTGSPYVGLLVGILTGLAIGVIHGIITVYLKGNQIISGVGINLLGGGLIAFGLIAAWQTPGHHVVSKLTRMPAIQTHYGGISYITLLTVLLALITYYLLNRTKLGLTIQATGEHPRAADVSGVSVEKIRFLSTAIGASLAGLGGAFLCLDWFGVVTKDLAAGRGFIALATVVFSNLNPLLALLGGFIFGFFDSLGVWVSSSSAIKQAVPWQVILMLPYLVTLIAVAGVIGRADFPSKLGEPYRRE
ncbi:MAG: ABC transporter permease [Candidatus Bipolaricaulota bacterium]